MKTPRLTLVFIVVLSLLAVHPLPAAEPFVVFHGDPSAVILAEASSPLRLFSDDHSPGVPRALQTFCGDMEQVTGNPPSMLSRMPRRTFRRANVPSILVVGTVGHSRVVDRLLRRGKLPADELVGCREKYLITTIGSAVVIAGSDRRGTMYGIYELSRQAGVSPWTWWADVPVEHQDTLSVRRGTYTDGEPAVRYRGIFLNDEAPCLTTWVKNTWGTDYGDHRFYEHVFELLLRLKGNFLWPAMWGWSFYADDPLNSPLADEMGIIMGTSHHEPMARNHQEYARHRDEWGAWDYVSNKENLDRFFREGMERAASTEDLITIGMRGDGDTSMGGREGHDDEDPGGRDERIMRILTDVIDNQRSIIADVTGRPAEERPQVWALYKEVQNYYDRGLRVPDDVTILLSDDNWGDIRRVPTAAEQQRAGGWGIYYHVDYVGAPRNTKWLNVTPLANMWEQLQLVYSYGVDRLWVLNVGDLKPMEMPISFFLDMAWDPTSVATFGKDTLSSSVSLMPWLEQWCTQQFGPDAAAEAARILDLTTFYNGRSTPEMLDAHTFDVASGEWRLRRDEYVALADDARALFGTLPAERLDAARQLFLYPVEAMANLYDMYYAAATGDDLGVQRAFDADRELSRVYNKEMSGGKWDGMMVQKHIGYRTWNDDFPADTPPAVLPAVPSRPRHPQPVVAFEAEECCEAVAPTPDAEWVRIPHIGHQLSGMALMPYTLSPEGAVLRYTLSAPAFAGADSIRVAVTVKSTLPFLRKEGHRYHIHFEGADGSTVEFNHNVDENHPYDILYPTVARRIIRRWSVLPVPANEETLTLCLEPLDPGIVFEHIELFTYPQ